MKWIVGQVEGVEQPVKLGEFFSEREALAFLAELPGIETGCYYLDEVMEDWEVERAEREERMKPVLDRIPEIWGKELQPAGWDDLVLALDAELAALDPDYEIHQTKSKFGALRFYAESKVLDAKQLREIVEPYEYRSMRMCPWCGAEGLDTREKHDEHTKGCRR